VTEKRIEPGPFGVIVARNLAELRATRRLTYVDLAARLAAAGRPIPVLGLSRIERGERRVDVDDLARLAFVFGISNPWTLAQSGTCITCGGTPPQGLVCTACGAGSQP
jgi:transcriptional regulator with XRE-family HTH domain